MSSSLPLKVESLGHFLPPRVVNNAEVESRCGVPAGWVAERCGVHSRRWVQDETGPQMGAAAAREALDRAGLDLRDIDLILNASGTPEQVLPDGGALLQRELGPAAAGIAAFSVHSTCLSFMTALDVSASLLAAGRYRRILIVSSEISSRGINFADPESAGLLGDAAVAAIVRRPDKGDTAQLLAARLETYGEGAPFTEVRGGGNRHHPNNPTTRPEDNLFHMAGPQLFKLALKHLPPFLEAMRPGLSQELGSISRVVPHQPSGLGLRVLERFGWPAARIEVTLREYGNCVAASIPLTLYQAVEAGRIQRGDEVLLIGTGAGLSFGGLILIY